MAVTASLGDWPGPQIITNLPPPPTSNFLLPLSARANVLAGAWVRSKVFTNQLGLLLYLYRT